MVSEEGVEQRAAPLLDAQLNHPAGGDSVAAVRGEARQLTRPWCSFESAVDRGHIVRPTSYTGRTSGWKLRKARHVKLEPTVHCGCRAAVLAGGAASRTEQRCCVCCSSLCWERRPVGCPARWGQVEAASEPHVSVVCCQLACTPPLVPTRPPKVPAVT